MTPLGIFTSRVTAAGDREQTASLFGVEPRYADLSPGQQVPTEPGTVVLAQRSFEALDAEAGEEVFIFGEPYTVAGVSQDAEYSHTGVIWMTIDDWRDTVAKQTAEDAPLRHGPPRDRLLGRLEPRRADGPGAPHGRRRADARGGPGRLSRPVRARGGAAGLRPCCGPTRPPRAAGAASPG